MKITLKPEAGVTGTPVVLGDDALPLGNGQKFILFTSPEFTRNVDPAESARAEEVEVFDRKNLQTTYTFAVYYQFASADACNRFLIDLGGTSRDRGILEVNFPDSAVRRLTGTWSNIKTLEQVGKSCTVLFTFLGGRFA